MLIVVPDVLSAEQVAEARKLLDAAEWVDGKVTAGYQSARAKDNVQIPEGHYLLRFWRTSGGEAEDEADSLFGR